MPTFKMSSQFEPAGDQPDAIEALCAGLVANERFQVLEGVTGSGKTFTASRMILDLTISRSSKSARSAREVPTP